MKYADIKFNDIANGEGVCVSFWTQGCPHRCKGCHNPQTWDFNSGKEEELSVIEEKILHGLTQFGVKRNFSVLGGEPLCEQNLSEVSRIVKRVRQFIPNIKIYIWTGYTLNELLEWDNEYIDSILDNVDVIIDGQYIEAERDITLKLRGSKNQKILHKGVDY